MKRSNPFTSAETFVERLKKKVKETPKATLKDVENVLVEVKKRLIDPKDYPWYIKLDPDIDWSEMELYFPGTVSSAFLQPKDWIQPKFEWYYRFTDFSVDCLPKTTRKMEKLYTDLIELDNNHLDGDAAYINELLDQTTTPRIFFLITQNGECIQKRPD